VELNEYLEVLDGQEILSSYYEGCVGINKKQVIYEGKVIDTLNKEKAGILLDEMFENEFGLTGYRRWRRKVN